MSDSRRDTRFEVRGVVEIENGRSGLKRKSRLARLNYGREEGSRAMAWRCSVVEGREIARWGGKLGKSYLSSGCRANGCVTGKCL
jgi:hypothetical protein